eukprot:5676168-Prymnesium_polylepis.4
MGACSREAQSGMFSASRLSKTISALLDAYHVIAGHHIRLYCIRVHKILSRNKLKQTRVPCFWFARSEPWTAAVHKHGECHAPYNKLLSNQMLWTHKERHFQH